MWIVNKEGKPILHKNDASYFEIHNKSLYVKVRRKCRYYLLGTYKTRTNVELALKLIQVQFELGTTMVIQPVSDEELEVIETELIKKFFKRIKSNEHN